MPSFLRLPSPAAAASGVEGSLNPKPGSAQELTSGLAGREGDEGSVCLGQRDATSALVQQHHQQRQHPGYSCFLPDPAITSLTLSSLAVGMQVYGMSQNLLETSSGF